MMAQYTKKQMDYRPNSIKQLVSVTGYCVFLAVMTMGLTACSGNNADLTDYIDKVKQRKKVSIKPLPEFKPYETYAYQSDEAGGRDPFKRFFGIESKSQQAGSESGLSPDSNRRKEALEEFPLDTLRMVGILQQQEDIWAVMEASDGTIHRVQRGNYMGQNHGKIVSVGEDKIQLVEIVPNGQGGWMERPAKIALSEPQ